MWNMNVITLSELRPDKDLNADFTAVTSIFLESCVLTVNATFWGGHQSKTAIIQKVGMTWLWIFSGMCQIDLYEN